MDATPRNILIWRWLLIALALVLVAGPMQGQAPTATLVGRVTDVSQAVIPGASIEVRNAATNIARKASSNGHGEFTVTNLDPGQYVVTFTEPGFQTLRKDQITLEADQTARVDATLQPGNVSETVSVSASDVGLLNTETSTKGTVITPVEITEMPLISRDFNDLAFTVPGVQPSEQRAKGANYVANGSRSDSAGIYIDGINDESPRDAGSQISPPLDSIQEFRMETADYTAQYGRLGGSVVNLAIKTGANKVHGSVFDYVRNDFFDALPYSFSGLSANTKLRKNQFGGDLTGPIWLPHVYNGHDRTFFNLAIEIQRQITGSISDTVVPTALERAGDFSQSLPGGLPYYFHNPTKSLSKSNACDPTGTGVVAGCLYPAPYDKIPASKIDPVAKALLAYIPLPNIPNYTIGGNNYEFNGNKVSHDTNSLLKITHKLTASDDLEGLFDRHFSKSS